MVYDRNSRGTNPGDQYNYRGEDYGRDYGSGRDYSPSSAREYQAAGAFDRDDDDRGGGYGQSGGQYGSQSGRGGDWRGDQDRWGQQDYGNAGYAQGFRNRGQSYGGQSYGGQQYGQSRGGGDYDRGQYGAQGYGRSSYGGNQGYGSRGGWDDGRGGRGGQQRFGQGYGQRDYGRQPQGYDYDERGFFQRAGDEVRSWFGDDEAERRRDMDARYDEQRYNNDRDSDYHSWRQGQISQLDRDYDEYRRENRSKFENEFSTWRTGRQGQRDLLTKVDEHMDVVGSDGAHVGTVDKVRGDRILLTKNDQDAGGHHHSIPSSWLQTVDTKVTLSKTADEAKKHWRDEERNQAMLSGDTDRDQTGGRDAQGRMLNRSFSGTY